MSTQQQEKRYDPSDTTLKLVRRPDDITLDDDPNTLRAEMSCGHAVTPQSVNGWCRSLLDQGQYKFACPALLNNTNQKCGAEWSYTEIRKMAMLTAEEQAHFEETMAMLAAAAEYCEFKRCPGCQAYVEREDLANLCVHCKVCTTRTGQAFEFCWLCLRTWKGPAPCADKCDNEGCVNPDMEKLTKCHLLTLTQVRNIKCPSIRACPTCGHIIEHDGTGCKNIICNRCHFEFCFVCLKLTPDCLATSTPFLPCSDGVADRQTRIPTWNTNRILRIPTEYWDIRDFIDEFDEMMFE